MKTSIITGFTASISALMIMSSCLGDYTETDISLYRDAQISSMTLSHDSVPALDSAKFTIDQVKGFIYNVDSLPYGTEVGKVITTLTYSSSIGAVMVAQGADNDSTWWNGSDSIDFSLPVTFRVTALDGATTKNYIARVNIHQVNPDTMLWTSFSPMTGFAAQDMKVIKHGSSYIMYAAGNGTYKAFTAPVDNLPVWTEQALTDFPGKADVSQITAFADSVYLHAEKKIYRSGDGLTWSEDSSAPAVLAVTGVVEGSRPYLTGVAEKDGSPIFFSRLKGEPWKYGTALPDSFPSTGFATLAYERMGDEYLMIAGGHDLENNLLNGVWATSDGLSWAHFTSPTAKHFPKREGASLAIYDNLYLLIGGMDGSGKTLKDVYTSPDNGLSWFKTDSTFCLPAEYTNMAGSSVFVNDDNYMMIFGGKSAPTANHADVLWRGRITRLGFGKN